MPSLVYRRTRSAAGGLSSVYRGRPGYRPACLARQHQALTPGCAPRSSRL